VRSRIGDPYCDNRNDVVRYSLEPSLQPELSTGDWTGHTCKSRRKYKTISYVVESDGYVTARDKSTARNSDSENDSSDHKEKSATKRYDNTTTAGRSGRVTRRDARGSEDSDCASHKVNSTVRIVKQDVIRGRTNKKHTVMRSDDCNDESGRRHRGQQSESDTDRSAIPNGDGREEYRNQVRGRRDAPGDRKGEDGNKNDKRRTSLWDERSDRNKGHGDKTKRNDKTIKSAKRTKRSEAKRRTSSSDSDSSDKQSKDRHRRDKHSDRQPKPDIRTDHRRATSGDGDSSGGESDSDGELPHNHRRGVNNTAGNQASHRYMKPDKYSGSASIETFLIQFGLCASYNNWSKTDKVMQLKCCLTGAAAQILRDDCVDGNVTYNELVSKLRARFGPSGLHDRFAVELRSRRRNPKESIADLHADIRRLEALAYPDSAHSELGQVIARDHFNTALGDREIELKVRDRDPINLEEAYKAAIRVETYLKAYDANKESGVGSKRETTSYYEGNGDIRNRRDIRRDDNRVRQVAQSIEKKSTVDETSQLAMTQLCAQLEKVQREKDELGKENGRLNLLTEQA